MDEFNDYFTGMKPLELLEKLGDNFSTNDDYWYFDNLSISSFDERDLNKEFDYIIGEIAGELVDGNPHLRIDNPKINKLLKQLY
jgi:hypothetical protein